ncbi:hypothetical protein CaCOL14_013370 [Colletotrichum acutatum]
MTLSSLRPSLPTTPHRLTDKQSRRLEALQLRLNKPEPVLNCHSCGHASRPFGDRSYALETLWSDGIWGTLRPDDAPIVGPTDSDAASADEAGTDADSQTGHNNRRGILDGSPGDLNDSDGCHDVGNGSATESHDHERTFIEFGRGFGRVWRAQPLFSFIDVGTGKESADHKIREMLCIMVRIGQCKLVFSGPCHDNG